MTVDLSLIVATMGTAISIFGLTLIYLSNLRLRGTLYSEQYQRVELDKTRAALEADIKKIYDEIYRDRGRWNEINHLQIDAARSTPFRTFDEQIASAVDGTRFLSNFGISIRDVQVIQNQVFLLTPLSDEEIPVTNAVQAACEKTGLKAVRGDESNISGAILPVIIRQIVQSRFVIANLNGRNPNVFYEMGIAQALGKDVLMFSHRDEIDNLPFDVAQQQIIFYRSTRQLHERLLLAVAQLGWVAQRSVSQNP